MLQYIDMHLQTSKMGILQPAVIARMWCNLYAYQSGSSHRKHFAALSSWAKNAGHLSATVHMTQRTYIVF